MLLHVVFLSVLLSEMCQCEKSDNENENRATNESHASDWKQDLFNNSSPCVSYSSGTNAQGKTCQKKWSEPGYIHDSMRIISKRLRTLSPTFMLPSYKISNERCRVENDVYISDLEDLRLWALKMYDSTGKLPSGLLNGNVNQFGDFDQCINAENSAGDVKGKYCLAYFQINLKSEESTNQEIYKMINLMLSHSIFRSTMNDSGHRVPRFSTINWGICVPSSCSHMEIESHLKDLTRLYTDGLDFEVEVRVDEEMCHTKKPFQFSMTFIIVSVLLLTIIAIVVISTIRDFLNGRSDAFPTFYTSLLDCFSLTRNFKSLISMEPLPDDINTIHGIRAVNAILLLASHKSMAIFFSPFSNRTFLAEELSQPWSILARIASLYTDSFIMVSGTLTAYSYSKTLKKNGSLDIKREYINRLIRIFPLFIVTVLLGAFVIPELGSGPLWGLTVNNHSKFCKNSWWRNFLFIHNYFGFENMCLTHTHHLGIDTQLFFLSPALVYILYKWELGGIVCLVFLAGISTNWRYRVGVEKNLSYFIYPGITVSRMMDTANHSYILPSHRLTVYVIGLITGYLLHSCGRNFKMKSHVRKIWWMATFTLFSLTISKAMSMSHLGFVYDKYEAATYNALAPIGWCLFLAWIIFVSHINCGGFIGRMLTWKYNIIWTRISYAVYLIQFPIFFFNIGRLRYTNGYSFFSSLINIHELACVIGASTLLTLFFDMPTNNIRKLLRVRSSKYFSVMEKEVKSKN